MFKFEADFVESLRCIPMQVRMKLDTCGIKLKLTHWHQFNRKERESLVIMPCTTEEEVKTYGECLQRLVIQYTGKPASELAIAENPPWLNETKIPETVREKATEMNVSLSLQQWQKLTPDRRFALIKLSRPSHENKNFLPAMKEFQLL
ncbi:MULTISPECIES: nitrate reductase associated protein [Spirulina sp. CCY15215]|uniref:nitrate reductase associated protein n=1 Tax=Spirulina sp. CCY15215 TaxID=2767591 RepID=UPI00194E06CD|nr:nitrate reductase associated protein [Spirulina major]